MPLVLPQIASLLLTKGVDVGRQAAKQLAGTLAFACLVALTGCSGASEDDVPTTAASTADEPSTEPAQPEGQEAPGPPVERPVEPVAPMQAQGTTVRSAEAFVGYYIDLLNYAMVTGDTKAFRAASMDCEGCERYADLFDRTYARGGSAQTEGWRVTGSFGAPIRDNVRVIADIRAAPLIIKNSSTSQRERYAADAYELTLELQQQLAAWHVVDLSGA
jgi:hypothetical protein